MATAHDRFPSPTMAPADLRRWVEQVALRTHPERVQWCDGSDEEYGELIRRMLAAGDLHRLNPDEFPACYLHRSHPSDVARVEHLTFVCTKHEADAGPNNSWLAPDEARRKMDALFDGCMRGRTMYVIPYCMGPIDSPYARCGVEITDSAYVAANMRLMTRIGEAALARIAGEGTFVRGLHSIGELDPERRFIVHFPEALEIQSYGSGYGGNALLGKKCHALRIASWQARDWAHGVLVGAGMASETTAAAAGDVGVVRRDPMAMKPFAGYNFGDYWNHWLAIGDRMPKLPGVFHVNWFRRDAQGRFLWPGYGENLRVLAWIIARSTGRADAVDTPIGAVPKRDSLDLTGLALDEATVAELLAVDPAAWRQEAIEIGRYFETFGSRLPERLDHQLALLHARLA